MKQKYEVLTKHIHDGKSFRQIARELGIHRETVGKYVREYEQKRDELINGGEDVRVDALIESLTEKPSYKASGRMKRKAKQEVLEQLSGFLHENAEKRQRGQHKQQKKIMDMYEALDAQGMDISYSTVRRIVRSMERKVKEAFIKADHAPGAVCEFDWGEVKLTIEERLQVFQMALFTSAYSNFRFACLFPKQSTECFQEAHARFFEYIGGVHQTMLFDNMKVAVKKFVGTEKEPTEALMALSLYYGFSYRFCNVRRGNEKGHVERSVDVVRRKDFAFRDEFASLQEANAYLLEVCNRLNSKPSEQHGQLSPRERLKQERSELLILPPKWDAARVTYSRVDKCATVIIDQNRYSVPDHLVGEKLMVKVYAERIHCFHAEECVAEHERLCGQHQWRLELDHVLMTLRKKPGALAGSMALQQADKKIKTIYTRYYTGKEKDFIALLQYLKEGGQLEDVFRSIEQLSAMHPQHVTTDKIKILCARQNEQMMATESHSGVTQKIVARSRAHARAYDQMFRLVDPKTEVIH